MAPGGPALDGAAGENFEIRLSNLLQMDYTKCFYIKISLDVKCIYFVIATNQIIFSKCVILLTAPSIFRFNFELLILIDRVVSQCSLAKLIDKNRGK